MTNTQELREEIEKGCGLGFEKVMLFSKEFHSAKKVWINCGNEGFLCPSCQKALDTLNKCEEIFKEMIESKIEILKDRLGNPLFNGDRIIWISDVIDGFFKELLSQFNSHPSQRDGSKTDDKTISNENVKTSVINCYSFESSGSDTSQLKQEVKPIILDDNPLSISMDNPLCFSMYIEGHSEVKFEEEKEKKRR